MPILVDLSQVALSNLMMSPDIKKGIVDPMLIKHMVLNSVRSYKQKFSQEYGQIVICCDSQNYWRKNIFPHYKANRKTARKKSKIDWNEIFDCISSFKDELRENFPYKVIEVDQAEGDDVIAVIAKNETEKTLIVGGDKDYHQLLQYDHVDQYSPTKKQMIKVDDAVEFLNALIITGDKDDGIPNIRSDSDTFVNESKRQKSIKKTEIGSWKKMTKEQFCESRAMLENHKRNEELINFEFIPENVCNAILEEYKIEPLGNKSKIMNYFMKNRMRNLLSDLDQF